MSKCNHYWEYNHTVWAEDKKFYILRRCVRCKLIQRGLIGNWHKFEPKNSRIEWKLQEKPKCETCQPKTGEFTREVRKMKFASVSTGGISVTAIINKLKEACDIIDRQQAEIENYKKRYIEAVNDMAALQKRVPLG